MILILIQNQIRARAAPAPAGSVHDVPGAMATALLPVRDITQLQQLQLAAPACKLTE